MPVAAARADGTAAGRTGASINASARHPGSAMPNGACRRAGSMRRDALPADGTRIAFTMASDRRWATQDAGDLARQYTTVAVHDRRLGILNLALAALAAQLAYRLDQDE